MAQRSLSQWFVSSSTGKSGQLAESDSKEEDLLAMECTPVDSPSSLVSDSDGNHSDEDQQELAPPVTKKVARSVISRYNTKHPWLISDESGKGAFCKFCQQLYLVSRVPDSLAVRRESGQTVYSGTSQRGPSEKGTLY